MSQRADGGLIATKPYVSSAAYLQRMGDYCQGCAYNPKLKTGPRACPFNALYWDFFARHAETLGANHRLALVYRQWQKMPTRAANRPASARPAGAPAAGRPVTTTPLQRPAMQSLPTGYQALILGATGAIGGAIAAQLQADPRCAQVLTLSRQSTPAIDFDAARQHCRCRPGAARARPLAPDRGGHRHAHRPHRRPRKRLADLNAAHTGGQLRHQHHRPGRWRWRISRRSWPKASAACWRCCRPRSAASATTAWAAGTATAPPRRR